MFRIGKPIWLFDAAAPVCRRFVTSHGERSLFCGTWSSFTAAATVMACKRISTLQALKGLGAAILCLLLLMLIGGPPGSLHWHSLGELTSLHTTQGLKDGPYPHQDQMTGRRIQLKHTCPSSEAFASAELLWEAGRASCDRYSATAQADLEEAAVARQAAGNRTLSVIIGAYQRPLTLELQLRALAQQKLVKVEVIVVDAGSSPPLLGCVPSLSALAHAYLYRAYDGRYHRVRSFNEGVQVAQYASLVLLDDDVVPMSDYWAHGALVALEGHAMARLPMIIKEFKPDLQDIHGRVGEISSIVDWPTSYHGFTTCNLAVNRTSWHALGGFDVALDGRYGGEDHDWHKRAKAAGLTYGRGPAYSCALHVGVFYGNRGLPVATRV